MRVCRDARGEVQRAESDNGISVGRQYHGARQMVIEHARSSGPQYMVGSADPRDDRHSVLSMVEFAYAALAPALSGTIGEFASWRIREQAPNHALIKLAASHILQVSNSPTRQLAGAVRRAYHERANVPCARTAHRRGDRASPRRWRFRPAADDIPGADGRHPRRRERRRRPGAASARSDGG